MPLGDAAVGTPVAPLSPEGFIPHDLVDGGSDWIKDQSPPRSVEAEREWTSPSPHPTPQDKVEAGRDWRSPTPQPTPQEKVEAGRDWKSPTPQPAPQDKVEAGRDWKSPGSPPPVGGEGAHLGPAATASDESCTSMDWTDESISGVGAVVPLAEQAAETSLLSTEIAADTSALLDASAPLLEPAVEAPPSEAVAVEPLSAAAVIREMSVVLEPNTREHSGFGRAGTSSGDDSDDDESRETYLASQLMQRATKDHDPLLVLVFTKDMQVPPALLPGEN